MTSKNIKSFKFYDFTLDLIKRELTAPDGSVISISSRAFDTLLALVERRGSTLTKQELISIVWPNLVVEDNNLNQAISTLRKALGDSKSASMFIKTIPGRGYSFIAPVTVCDYLKPAPTETVQIPEETVDSSLPPPIIDESRSASPAASLFHPWPLAAAIFLLILTSIVIIRGMNHTPEPDEESANVAPAPADQREDVEVELIPNSVAVMPFAVLTPTEDNNLFSLGLHDEVINQLAKIRSLNVISRSSVMALSTMNPSPRETARQLKVEAVITGNILFAGKKARVSLQMADPLNGVTLWADTFEAESTDIESMMSIQTDIANLVASALQAEINSAEQVSLATVPTDSFKAYRYQLAAREAYDQLDFETAWELSRLALEHDPDYSDAHYLFSSVNTVMSSFPFEGMSSSDHTNLALVHASRMIELSPQTPEGYVLKGAALSISGDWLGVAREIEKLEQMNAPISKLNLLATFYMSVGEFDRAIEVIDANLITEPVNLFARGFLMVALEISGERERSREEYAIGEELRPAWWGDTVNTFLAMGRGEALTDIDQIAGITEGLRDTLRNLHDVELIENELVRYLNTPEEQHTNNAIYYSALAALQGKHDVAVDLMRSSLDTVWLNFYFLWLPVFDETRKTEEFSRLLDESGLIEYWNLKGWPSICRPDPEGIRCDWQAYPDQAAVTVDDSYQT